MKSAQENSPRKPSKKALQESPPRKPSKKALKDPAHPMTAAIPGILKSDILSIV
jgi:hypothetical protein